MFLAPFRVNELLKILVQCTACKEGIELPSKALEVETYRRTSVAWRGEASEEFGKVAQQWKSPGGRITDV
jgi:hypothetical protein